MENVKTESSPAKIAAVPLPWCTSQIDDDDAREPRLGLHRARGDGGVVEDAEAFATIAKRVVRAAGEIGAPAARSASRARGERGAAGAARALHHAFRPWKADRASARPAKARRKSRAAGNRGNEHA